MCNLPQQIRLLHRQQLRPFVPSDRDLVVLLRLLELPIELPAY
jgi:hypothetical protein